MLEALSRAAADTPPIETESVAYGGFTLPPRG
jgi:hypothetical protein